jgi:C1A family cysteine protease
VNNEGNKLNWNHVMSLVGDDDDATIADFASSNQG